MTTDTKIDIAAWIKAAEKRLTELEEAVFEDASFEPTETRLDKFEENTQLLLKMLTSFWTTKREPVPYRTASARFARAIQAAGSDLTTWLTSLESLGYIRVVQDGARRLIFLGSAELTLADRARWNLTTPEEREALEQAQVEAELRAMLKNEHKDG